MRLELAVCAVYVSVVSTTIFSARMYFMTYNLELVLEVEEMSCLVV